MPIGCRLLPFPPALRNKQHARAVAFALARRLAGIPDGDMLTGGVAAHAKFLPRPDKTIRRPAFQFFLAHRATPPTLFHRYTRSDTFLRGKIACFPHLPSERREVPAISGLLG
jgi:hypothetical protein